MEIFTASGMTALLQVIGIDLVLAGDNAVVIGLAAAGLPPALRNRAILVGILAATVLRIGLALLATRVLGIPGVELAGGLLLLWVCWKMWTELREGQLRDDPARAPAKPKTFARAAVQIVIADVSMSLDNVLAVAGAAREHPAVLVVGLAFSIALMGLAANAIARLLNRQRWIAFVGLAIIVSVAAGMIWSGGPEVAALLRP